MARITIPSLRRESIHLAYVSCHGRERGLHPIETIYPVSISQIRNVLSYDPEMIRLPSVSIGKGQIRTHPRRRERRRGVVLQPAFFPETLSRDLRSIT